MKYKIKKNFTTDPQQALIEILQDRGVTDVDNFMYPTAACENDPFLLMNIQVASDMLLKHLCQNNKILIVNDCDTDGICAASILWLYIKKNYPDADLSFIMHEHKQHGLQDIIDWIEEQDFKLICVPDAGSYDINEHQRLEKLGMDVIILD